MKNTSPWFDESLAALLEVVTKVLGEGVLDDGVAIRDAFGQLSFVSGSAAPEDLDIEAADLMIRERLGPYARPDTVLKFADSLFADRILKSPDRMFIQAAARNCWLLDRRIVGAGWLAEPSSEISVPPRIIFASLKGGVGRSTALAVTAFDMATRGQNILVVDLDLEAPGLGELLLPSDRTPQFGVLDYLVESGLADVADECLPEFLGTSPLTVGGGGRVDVLPALGRASENSPQNVLPKLSRAVAESLGSDGVAISLGCQLSKMIDRFSAARSYDLILIDSRAGLAEIAAPAVLGLGGLVLLFGTAQYQTIAGYRSLFAGLKLLATKTLSQGKAADWRLMLKPVYAKASLNASVAERHQAELYDLFSENVYDEDGSELWVEHAINFGMSDPSAPHVPLVIPFDPRFTDFDPHHDVNHVARAFYEQTFRPFLHGLDVLLRDQFGDVAKEGS